MINLDQKYESYVRNGSKKLRIDGIEERVRGYGYTDDGKDIDGYYLITDNYTLYYVVMILNLKKSSKLIDNLFYSYQNSFVVYVS